MNKLAALLVIAIATSCCGFMWLLLVMTPGGAP